VSGATPRWGGLLTLLHRRRLLDRDPGALAAERGRSPRLLESLLQRKDINVFAVDRKLVPNEIVVDGIAPRRFRKSDYCEVAGCTL
jgi:hypothetical protein